VLQVVDIGFKCLWSGEVLKKAKKEFPQADAMLITCKTGGSDQADTIKFK
jgi:hypothetical protein